MNAAIVAMTNHSAGCSRRWLRRRTSQKKWNAKTSQEPSRAMSSGHSSSASSLPWVWPSGMVSTAAAATSCQLQKWMAPSRADGNLA